MKIQIVLILLIIPLFCYSQTPDHESINNYLNTLSNDSVIKEDSGWHYFFIHDTTPDGWYLKMSYVKPHQRKHKAHSHENDEIIYILEGIAEITIDGVTKTVGPNTSVYFPKKSLHGLSNAGDSYLRYLVIKKN